MDSVQIYKLFIETSCLARRYERAVREGKELLAAVEWSRYVVNGGVVALLRQVASASVIAIDVDELEKRITACREEAQVQWSCSMNRPTIDLSEVEAIHRKVDAIERMLRGEEKRVVSVDFAKVG